ncbi:hypothetical protein OHS18_30700 [Amycolatopsis sp. NBC_00355]|uniref:hypothetical protein n=1 Tax=Amycolatopsis sp. NBC_00355 TaxID=2975957 RepID=UPI002E25A4D7
MEQRLSPDEQRALLVQLGKLVRAHRADAERPAVVDFRQVGKHVEIEGHNSATPDELADLFGRLRQGMYTEERGTWLQARFTLVPDGSFDFDFALDDDPVWTDPPEAAAYPAELGEFWVGLDEYLGLVVLCAQRCFGFCFLVMRDCRWVETEWLLSD